MDNEEASTSRITSTMTSKGTRTATKSIGTSTTSHISDSEKAPVELRVGDKVYKIKMGIREWLESRRDDFELKKRKRNADEIDCCQALSMSKIKVKSDQALLTSKINVDGYSLEQDLRRRNINTSGFNFDQTFYTSEIQVRDTSFDRAILTSEINVDGVRSTLNNASINSNQAVFTSITQADNINPDITISRSKIKVEDINSNHELRTKKTASSTMTDNFPISPYEELSPEEQSLKVFFDSMLRTTQSLPEFHQRRIKGDLVKALRYHGVKVTAS